MKHWTARLRATKHARDVVHLDVEAELKLADTDAGQSAGAIEGYASMFSLLDRGGDVVEPGAFRRTLGEWRRRKALPPMLWQHDPGQPIGVWTSITEDERGLKVAGELVLDIPQAAMVHALAKRGAVRGLSIGYRSRNDNVDATGARRIRDVDLYEISLVTIPMLAEAQITGVKGGMAADLLKNWNPGAMEDALREAGLSGTGRKTAVRVFREWLQREAGEPEPAPREAAADVLMALRAARAVART